MNKISCKPRVIIINKLSLLEKLLQFSIQGLTTKNQLYLLENLTNS